MGRHEPSSPALLLVEQARLLVGASLVGAYMEDGVLKYLIHKNRDLILLQAGLAQK